MNKRTAPALAGILALGLFLSACATFQSNAIKSYQVITTGVEAARKGWVDYVTQQRILVAGQPEQAKALELQVLKVGVVYSEYQQAAAAASDALNAYAKAPADQSRVEAAMSALAAASGKLIPLIKQITGK